jgi:cell division protein FtsB
MSQLTEKLVEEHREPESSKNALFVPMLLALSIVMIAMFIGDMLFGKNSLEVYLALEKQEAVLSKKIYQIKNQNAMLQRKYFEFKNIMPEEESE